MLDEHPVLERAGFRLVGVADEVVRLRRLAGDRGPLPAGRERGPATAHEARRGDLLDDLLRPHREGPGEALVPTRRPVVGEARRVDPPDAAEEPQAGRWASSTAWGTIAARSGFDPGSAPSSSAKPARASSRRLMTPTASTGEAVNVRGRSPAIVNRAAGRARTGRGRGCAARSPGRRERACPAVRAGARGRHRSPPRRRAGRRCRRRRGRRPGRAASSRRGRRTSRPRMPRRAAPSGVGRCTRAPAG